jgi:hypothetical protein
LVVEPAFRGGIFVPHTACALAERAGVIGLASAVDAGRPFRPRPGQGWCWLWWRSRSRPDDGKVGLFSASDDGCADSVGFG